MFTVASLKETEDLVMVSVSKVQIQRSGFDSQHYQIFWEVMGLEWVQPSLVSTTEELLERKTSGSV
jgi:hypothetical protein